MNSASVRAGASLRTTTFSFGPAALLCGAFDIFEAVCDAVMGRTPFVWLGGAIWRRLTLDWPIIQTFGLRSKRRHKRIIAHNRINVYSFA